jgi:hypothetical protein
MFKEKEHQDYWRKSNILGNGKLFYQDSNVISSTEYELINPSTPGDKTPSPQVPNEQATPSFNETSVSFEEDDSRSKKNDNIIGSEKFYSQVLDYYVPFHNTDSFRFISLEPLPKTVFVFNIPEIFDEHVIRQIFIPYGKITTYI